MVTIQGINPVTGFAAPKPAVKPDEAPVQSTETSPSDSVEVSEAGAAAAQLAVKSGIASEIRQEQVDAAKARLAEGAYKLQAVVLQVAARVAAFVD